MIIQIAHSLNPSLVNSLMITGTGWIIRLLFQVQVKIQIFISFLIWSRTQAVNSLQTPWYRMWWKLDIMEVCKPTCLILSHQSKCCHMRRVQSRCQVDSLMEMNNSNLSTDKVDRQIWIKWFKTQTCRSPTLVYSPLKTSPWQSICSQTMSQS